MATRRLTRTGALASVALALALATALAGVPAAASDADVHCSFVGLFSRPDGELVTADPVCFASLAEAVAHATGGAVELPPGVTGAELLAAQARSEARFPVDPQLAPGAYGFDQTQGARHYAIHFTGDNGTGSSATVSNIYCTGSEYWNANGAFVNSINSTYNACNATRHYDLPNLGSPGPATFGQAMTVTLPGYFKDRTESAKYYN